MNHKRDQCEQSQDASVVLISYATDFHPPPVSFSSHRFIPSLYELWHLNHWPIQLHPYRNTQRKPSLAAYSVTLRCVLSANTHRGPSLRMKGSNGCDLPVFSALERFHFIVMETQSGETSSCQGSADAQDLWWKITDTPGPSHTSNHLQTQYITLQAQSLLLHYHALSCV